MSTPATDAVEAVKQEIDNTPTEVSIEVPDMHPDAAMEAAKMAMSTVVGQISEAGLPAPEVPAVGPGTEQWDAVGGSITMDTTGPNPDVDLLVIRIVYIPDLARQFIATLLNQILVNASVAPRGSQPHQALLSQAHGHDYNDGLPEKEVLEDRQVETMGGKGDTKCPECGNDLNEVNGQVSGHRADCPYNLLGVPPDGAA